MNSLGYSLYDLAKYIYGMPPVFVAYCVSPITDERLQSCVEILCYCKTRGLHNYGLRFISV